MNPYEIIHLSSRLVLIRWNATPSAVEAHQFIDALQSILDNAAECLYFISDLRKGYITYASALNKLAQLSHHGNWAGSTSIGKGIATNVFVGLFEGFAHSDKDDPEIWEKPQDAIAYLEKLSPGLTQGIDWEEALK